MKGWELEKVGWGGGVGYRRQVGDRMESKEKDVFIRGVAFWGYEETWHQENPWRTHKDNSS